jgi:diguanylate cyclase (GGDEF)-like protein
MIRCKKMAMRENENIALFEEILYGAAQEFNDRILSNPCLQDFLKEADPDHLKRVQLSGFMDAARENETDSFQRFKRFASVHYDMGLPYVEYRDAFEVMHMLLIEKAGTIDNARTMHEAIEAFIGRARNASAAGYLERTLENDKKTLKRQTKRQVDIKAVKNHLMWLLEVIEDIENMHAKPGVEFDPEKCKFGKWLTTEEAGRYIEDPALRKSVENTHREIHHITQNIYRSIWRKDFHKIFIDYIMLVRQSLYLYNELNINVTQQTLLENVSKDALTGLLNRRSLNEVLKSELHLHALTGGAFCTVMFDLDRFKALNDSCGHQAGDRVLVAFATLLKKKMRKTDNIFRYGGEEFLAILPGTTAEEAYALSEKIRSAFEKLLWEGCLKKMTISVSIGIAQYTDAYRENPRRIIFEADRNLYRAKKSGRNRTMC